LTVDPAAPMLSAASYHRGGLEMEARTEGMPSAVRVATHLAPAVLPVYAIAARRVGEQLGRPVELMVPSDYDRCGADLDDVCFVCSVPYVLLRRAGEIAMEPIAAPLLRGGRYGGYPVYFSDVIVRADSPYRCFEDLDGARWAYNEPFSHSGYIVALHEMARIGAGPSFPGASIEAGYHDDAIGLVLNGRADWAAIDTQVLEIWHGRDPSLAGRLRVVATLGPSTIQPVVVSTTRLTAVERRLVLDALVGLDGDSLAAPLLSAAGIERFAPVADEEYADIRRMLDVVEAAGFLPDWWRPRWDASVARGLSRRRSRERAAAPARPRSRPRRSSPRPSRPRS
jgi:phosphonate transport system substrate-binding protein